MSKKELDYLLIPNSGGELGKQRKNRAIKELNKRGIKKVLILKGRDSEEDILYLGKILKPGNRIGFDTFPLHYKEYRVIIKKAQRDGKFPKKVKIENIKTPQSLKQEIYGMLGLEEEKLLHKEVKLQRDRNKFFQKIKNFIKRIIDL
jgi:hypothetical protein